MFTIKFCFARPTDKNKFPHERAACVYEASSYRIARVHDEPGGGEYCKVSFDFGENNSAEWEVGGPRFEDHRCAAVYITNSDGRTIESWRNGEPI